MQRPSITKEVREEVLSKTGGRCAYCGDNLGGYWHVDHVVAVHIGGSDDIENLLPACVSCNLSKSTLTVEKFRKYVMYKHDQLLRDEPKYRMLHRYGIIKKVKENITFYFEEHG